MEKYISDNSLREPSLLKDLREGCDGKKVNPLQEQLFRMLLKISGAKKCLIVGDFSGYSAVSCASAIGDQAEVITLHTDKEFVEERCDPFFEKANAKDKIKVKIGTSLDIMDELIRENETETFDFIHITGDSLTYDKCLERANLLAKIGGTIAIANTLTNVIQNPAQSLIKLNKDLQKDARFDVSLLNVETGVTLLRRVEPR